MPIVSSHMVAVRFSAMGDVALLTGPLLRWHEEKGIHFTVLTRAAFAPLFEGHPAITRVIGLKGDQLKGKEMRACFRALAEEYCGIPLLDLHGVTRTRLLSLFWKAPVHRYPKQGLSRRIFLLSGGRLCRNSLLARNVPQRYAAALSGVFPESRVWTQQELRPRMFLSPDEQGWTRKALAPLLQLSEETPAPLALHPFATHPSKAWPAQRWQELSLLLTEKKIPHFWIGKGNMPFSACSEHNSYTLNFINKTSLRELICLLSGAGALITGDSGPMHLADGVQTPVLALFGPTCREWGFFPSEEHDRVIQTDLTCRPCSLHGGGTWEVQHICRHNHACMQSITAEKVFRELTDMRVSGKNGVLFPCAHKS